MYSPTAVSYRLIYGFFHKKVECVLLFKIISFTVIIFNINSLCLYSCVKIQYFKFFYLKMLKKGNIFFYNSLVYISPKL